MKSQHVLFLTRSFALILNALANHWLKMIESCAVFPRPFSQLMFFILLFPNYSSNSHFSEPFLPVIFHPLIFRLQSFHLGIFRVWQSDISDIDDASKMAIGQSCCPRDQGCTEEFPFAQLIFSQQVRCLEGLRC